MERGPAKNCFRNSSLFQPTLQKISQISYLQSSLFDQRLNTEGMSERPNGQCTIGKMQQP
jgi:hypothetical protein